MTIVPVISLPTATVEIWPDCVRTTLPGSGQVMAAPEATEEYRARARALGYGDDIMAMCREHEILHSLLACWLGLPESPVLARLAAGNPMDREEMEPEEAAVLALQRLCRQHQIDVPLMAVEVADARR